MYINFLNILKVNLLLIILLSINIYSEIPKEMRISIYHDNFNKISTYFDTITPHDECIIESYNSNKLREEINLKIHVSKNSFKIMSSEIQKLGIVYDKQVAIKNDSSYLRTLLVELKTAKQMDTLYREILNKPFENSNKRIDLIAEYKERQIKIVNMENEISKELKRLKLYTLIISFSPRQLQSFDRRYFQFINMPGAEFHTLLIENPKKNKSAEFYKGGGVKWLFTKRNTHIRAGILRSSTKNKDEANDIFYLGLGHAFFPKFVGKKNEKFLNPYTSFTYGGMVLRSDSEKIRTFLNLSPMIGIELIKTHKILFDISSGYMIPLDINDNYNFRGWITTFNFNFVF